MLKLNNQPQQLNPDRAYIIVIGNEKGGAGKTTTAIHLIIYLLSLGFKVASIETDVRQQSLSNYLANRRQTSKLNPSLELLHPDHTVITSNSKGVTLEQHEQNLNQQFTTTLETLIPSYDFIVVDTPGSNSTLSKLAHSYADTVITPINDSFIDLDVLAKVSPPDFKVERPAHYAEMIWQQKIAKASNQQTSMNWLVVRNRLSTTESRNKRAMTKALDHLASRIGFQHILGFSERVIYRELFVHGLTLIDLNEANSPIALTLSHVAARSELRNLIRALNIEAINEALAQHKRQKQLATADAG